MPRISQRTNLRAARLSRRNNRRLERNNRRIERNTLNLNLNEIDELNDSFKIALNLVPSNFESFTCGSLSLRCSHCQAKHFTAEVTCKNTNTFTLCCHKGKVSLPPLTENAFFKNMYEGLSSSHPLIKNRSKNYFENIRSYNSAFAMISAEAKFSNSAMHGVYHFKIHDVFYHRSGSLIPQAGREPRYAQLYFYDVDTANAYRMRVNANSSCNINLMNEISNELYRVNRFVRSFKIMAEYCQQPGNEALNVSMVIKVNSNADLRRFNDAVQTDVAAIFTSTDGAPPFERNMVVFPKTTNSLRRISVLDSSMDPMAYPMLFPNGDTGWHTHIGHNTPSCSTATAPRNKVTMLQYASFRLAERDNFSLLHCSQKLFLQWIVDMYVRIEGTRLHFLRENQTTLRAEVYNNLTDFFMQQHNDTVSNMPIGRRVILPSSFIGSPRNMFQNYLDAMCIVQHFGKPSLFVTMTCNPRWPEILTALNGSLAPFRPDIIVRVFKCKLKELMNSIVKKKIFGLVEAIIYTIEFQKRGLPHAHILITLDRRDRIDNADIINKLVCAEIPDIQTHPKLHTLVKHHMIHGPCGTLNANSACMREGRCAKNYPKDFSENTRENVNGYPIYRRRDNGRSVDVRGCSVDNRFVVPYNSYLMAKFDCHLNVEVCSTVKSVKYIYKYVYKGYDCASLEFGVVSNDNTQAQADEIQNFLNGRFVGSTEAAWRIFEYPMHFQSHTIIRLDCHLPLMQNIVFREGFEQQAITNPRRTKLLAFFHLNNTDSSANAFLYNEIPSHYVWHDTDRKWNRRQRGGDKIISRIYVVSPKNIELFHMRLLLLHIRGPKSFDDLKKFQDISYQTFLEACHARGIASNDNEWQNCLNELKDTKTPKQLRQLFGYICGLNMPTNALALWNEFKFFMSEDFFREYSEDVAYNRSLLEIADILQTHNLTCHQLGLPIPILMTENSNFTQLDSNEGDSLFQEMYAIANSEQRELIDNVLREILYHDTGCNVFCLTAHAGCGKTFVQTAIIHKLNSLNLICIATAFSGIASTLLLGGRTLHNVFKLPIPILENSVSTITANSDEGQFIKSASLLIIDEVSMCPIYALKLIDKLLRDLADNENKEKLFGGKTILLSGDFRQILPVVPHGTRATLIENCIKSWSEYSKFHKVSFTQNMRALPQELEFINFLKSLGNGDLQTFPNFGNDIIQLPTNLIAETGNIIQDMYGNIPENILADDIINSVILAPKNDDCSIINFDILRRMPGQEKSYFSVDTVISDDDSDINNFPTEFLNSVTVSGLPPHKLILKENCIVLLIRNLNTKGGLVNGTRMRVKQMYANSLDCEILTGIARNTRILIPRIRLTYTGTLLPFTLQRTHFPIILAFAMTINKSQGQTFNKVAILLRQPVFTHGQLYVAASRVRSFNGLRFYVSESSEQGHLSPNSDSVYTKNIVFREIIDP